MATLLPPRLRKALSRLRLKTNLQTSGTYDGESLTQNVGSGVDFQDYREYEPGDDFRKIDWSIYHRLGKLFVKLYSEERSRTLTLLVDTSASMAMGRPTKVEYAQKIAAALGYVALWSGDEVQQFDVDRRLTSRTPRLIGRRRLATFFDHLKNIEVNGVTELTTPLTTYARSARHREFHPRGIAVFVSDLFDPDWEKALKNFSHVPGERVFIHLLAPDDWQPVGTGTFRLVDRETSESIELTVDDRMLRLYMETVDQWFRQIEEKCLSLGFAYYRIDTTFPLEKLLLETMRQGGLLA